MSELAKVLWLPIHRGHPPDAPRKIAEEAEASSRRERRARFVTIGLLVTALGLFWLGHVVGLVEDTAGVRDLPASVRLPLYRHAIDELTTTCREPAAAAGLVQEHCADQARFVLALPECTESCQRAAQLVLPHARR